MAEPGDIIVCDAGGDLTNSLMGELMLAHAAKRNVGGFVLNAAVRDVLAFLDVNLPVFAVGVSHRGPYKDGPGEINVPIAIDGMVIEPGDLVIGDWDGVLAESLSLQSLSRRQRWIKWLRLSRVQVIVRG
jgi:regulator of RNase E activity RraA